MEFYMTFHSVGNGIIIPTDEVHHFSEGLKPPTSIDQELWGSCCIIELMNDDRFQVPQEFADFQVSRAVLRIISGLLCCYSNKQLDKSPQHAWAAWQFQCTLLHALHMVFYVFSSLSWDNQHHYWLMKKKHMIGGWWWQWIMIYNDNR